MENLQKKDYLKGSEPISYVSKSDIGILISHGFTSTPDSFRYIANRLGEAGFNVEVPRLSGHSSRWQDLNNTKYEDWINDLKSALAALRKRADKIFVMGLSMGGTLALRLAQLNPDIIGVIVINHAIFLGNPAVFLVPLLRFIIKSTPAIAGDIKDPSAKELAYDRSPTEGVYQMTRLIKKVKKDFGLIKMPSLIFKSRDDHILPVKNATYTYSKIPSNDKELIWLDNSYHVATMDFDKDLIIEKTIYFINRHS
jgi:carboxylesterase